MAHRSPAPLPVPGILGDVTFQLARELPPDLRLAYVRLLHQVIRASVSPTAHRALGRDYDRLVTRWRSWREAIEADARRVEVERGRAQEDATCAAADAGVADTDLAHAEPAA